MFTAQPVDPRIQTSDLNDYKYMEIILEDYMYIFYKLILSCHIQSMLKKGFRFKKLTGNYIIFLILQTSWKRQGSLE